MQEAKIFSGTGASVAVSFVNGKYVVISLDQGFWETSDNFIRSAISDAPVGDFTEQNRVYNICENIYGTQARYYTPNIHPVFDNGKNELLVTYSLNYSANDNQDITVNELGVKVVDGNILNQQGYIDPYFYRVKGVRIPYSVIGISPDNTTSIKSKDQDFNNQIELFPNPASHVLNIESDILQEEDHYQIFDINGALVCSGVLKEGGIDISTLKRGVYVLGVQNENKEFKKKFIKQ